jgi:hypothetical protein
MAPYKVLYHMALLLGESEVPAVFIYLFVVSRAQTQGLT